MVDKKKAAMKGAKSKQKTLLDMFPKKDTTAFGAIQGHMAPPAIPEPLPAPLTISSDEPVLYVRDTVSPTPPDVPVASTSKILDLTVLSTTSKPPSKRTASSKPTSSRSLKPLSVEGSRDLNRVVIDLTAPFTSQTDVSKPTHSIFSQPSSGGKNSEKSRTTIDLTATPSPPTTNVPKPTYSIFGTRTKKPPAQTPPAQAPNADKAFETPLPDKASQHVRGPQTVFSSSSGCRYPKRCSNPAVEEPPHDFHFPSDVISKVVEPSVAIVPTSSFWEKEKCIEAISAVHKTLHPAIARLDALVASPPDASSSSEKLWSERWRPQRAGDVIGNEDNAIFLRDWMRALEVRFKDPPPSEPGMTKRGKGTEASRQAKRPQVMRSVARASKRRKRSDDGWMVSDASDYSSDIEVPETAGEDDDEFQPERPSGFYRHESSLEDDRASLNSTQPPRNSFDGHLANTIILAGASGSGKTAAVYACAEELGWDVFEVYPGIGKRNGASLEALIGEVGKNHLVRRTQARGTFSRAGDEPDSGNFNDFGFVAPQPVGDNQSKNSIRQSVILLEEVDILFKEDANFWPAVIRIIKDCKRAVVCTCNDLSFIPTSELPLQKILYFEPCPPLVAAAYLQGLCCAEGYIVQQEVLNRVYNAIQPDLRRSIQSLQLLCQGFPFDPEDDSDHLLDWNTASQRSLPHAELVSFIDAYATRNTLDRPKALASTTYGPGPDDELGYPILFDAHDDGYGLYDRDLGIVSTVMGYSHEARAVSGARVPEADYQAMIDVLRSSRAFPTGMMERSFAHTDYLPWARHIIAGDDMQEEAARGLANRGTRNSQRSYTRSLELSEWERGCIRRSQFKF